MTLVEAAQEFGKWLYRLKLPHTVRTRLQGWQNCGTFCFIPRNVNNVVLSFTGSCSKLTSVEKVAYAKV
jgi:hypothetical protein